MTAPETSPGATSLARSLIERVKKQRDLLQALGEHTGSVSVRVTSRDQSVSAEVGADGALTGLWLGPSAARLGADALAKLIVETAQEAARHVSERHAFLFQECGNRLDSLRNTPLTCWDGSIFVPGESRAAGEVAENGPNPPK